MKDLLSPEDIEAYNILRDNDYIKILNLIAGNENSVFYDNCIGYVDYFYALDFIIDKYKIGNQKLIHILKNIEYTKLDSLEEIEKIFQNNLFITVKKYNKKYRKALDELHTIFQTIHQTFIQMVTPQDYVNMAHVLASSAAPVEALYKASYMIKTSNLLTVKHSLVKILLAHKKCDSKMIENIYNVSEENTVNIINHPKTSIKILETYVTHNSSYVRGLVAASSKISEHSLFKLILDDDKMVRTIAYYNHNTSESVKEAAIFAGGVYSITEYNRIRLAEKVIHY